MFLLPLLACRCNTPPDDTTPPVTDPTGDPVGLLVVGHLAETAAYDAQTIVHGVFSPEDEWQEALDPVGAAANDGYDVYVLNDWFGLPPLGEEILDESLPWFVKDRVTWDAGDRILLGDDLVGYAEVFSDGIQLYVEDDEERLPISVFEAGGTLSFAVDGGADIAAQSADGIVVPEPIVLLEGDVMAIDVVGPDEAIGVSWEPSTNPDALMVVHAEGATYGVVRLVEDAEGSAVFSPEELADLDGEGITITLSRIVDTPLQLDEGVLTVRAMQETFLMWQQVESLGFFPERALIGERQVIEVYDVEGRFDEDSQLDLGEGVFTELLEVEPGGEVARFDVLVSDDAASGPRALTVHTTADSITSNQNFLMYVPLPPNDTCVNSQTGPALTQGELYFSDLDGLTNRHGDVVDCNGEDLVFEGLDQFHRMDLVQGDILNASAFSLYGDVAMLIYDDCGGQLLWCEDFGTDNEIEFLQWEVPATGTYYLLLDNYYDIERDELFVTWESAPPEDLIPWEPVRQGVDGQTLEFFSYSVTFDSSIAFDLGAGIAITGQSVTPEQVTLTVDVDADAEAGTREISATQGADTFTGTLDVAGVLPLVDTCEDADAYGSLASAYWYGTLEGSTNSGFDHSTWNPADFYGDVVLPVDIPAEGSSLHIVAKAEQDIAVSLFRTCEEGALPIRFRDAAGVADTEFLDFVAGAGEAGTYYLVLSALDEDIGLPFELFVTVNP